MKKSITFLVILCSGLVVNGQTNSKVIITAVLQTDWTFEKNGESFFKNHFTKNRIEYSFDDLTKMLVTKKYLSETYFSIWDRDTIVKEKIKTAYKKWSNQITLEEFDSLSNEMRTTTDTLDTFVIEHTSHHYLNIYLDLIQGNDTLSLSKTKPFDVTTPWTVNGRFNLIGFPLILNTAIDKRISEMLPKGFLCKELLIFMKSEDEK